MKSDTDEQQKLLMKSLKTKICHNLNQTKAIWWQMFGHNLKKRVLHEFCSLMIHEHHFLLAIVLSVPLKIYVFWLPLWYLQSFLDYLFGSYAICLLDWTKVNVHQINVTCDSKMSFEF
jgi:hypothetical protein